MINRLGQYLLAGTTSQSDLVVRVQKYSNIINGLLGLECLVQKEIFTTLLPPFQTDCGTAIITDFNCYAASIIWNNPFGTTLFSIKEIEVTEFEGRFIICFPVRVHEKQSIPNFNLFVKRMYKKIKDLDIDWGDRVSTEHQPYITIAIIDDLIKRNTLARILARSRLEKPLLFNLHNPTIFAGYDDGWHGITRDLNFV